MRDLIRTMGWGKPGGSGIAQSRKHGNRRADRCDHRACECEFALVETLREAGASTARAPGQPLFAGLRVYSIPVDFDQFLPEQRQLQTAVKNIGTSWSLSPDQLQQAVDAGRLLLRQHPCFQRLLLDLNATTAPVAPQAVRNSCPFEDDKAS